MKIFTRVSLLATLALIASCVSIPPTIRSVQTNDESTVEIATNAGSYGNGVITYCTDKICFILTAAHLCNPEVTLDYLWTAVGNGVVTQEKARQRLNFLSDLLEQRAFCNSQIVIQDSENPIDAVPLIIDFDKDLMLLVAYLPNTKSHVKISAPEEIKPGTPLYTIVKISGHEDKMVLYGKTGLTRLLINPIDKTKQKFLQTYFPIGPGASGAGVFLESSDLLVGTIVMQYANGNPVSPIRGTYVVLTKNIRAIFQKLATDFSSVDTLLAAKDKIHKESSWPYCYGKKQLCRLVSGEVKLIDYLTQQVKDRKSAQGAK